MNDLPNAGAGEFFKSNAGLAAFARETRLIVDAARRSARLNLVGRNMMRLKQLLGVFGTLLLCAAMAAATGSQLTGVNVSSSGNATTITLHATGSFSHNEYRPEDKVLLVDLAGVSADTLKEKQKAIESPAVKSYRVLSYKNASGAEVTRIELALDDVTGVSVVEKREGLQVQLTSAAFSPAPKSAAAQAAKPVVAAHAAPKSEPKPTNGAQEASATIRNISVSRSSNGMAIEIAGVTSAQVLELTGPDRLVLDFADTVPAIRTKNILVNSPEVKSIRIARNQQQPPVTRVVVDLKAPHEYKLTPESDKLIVNVLAASAAAATPATPAQEKPAAKPLAAQEAPVAKPAPVKPQPVLAAASTPSAVPVPKEELKPQPSIPQPSPEAKPQDSKAQDFAFVEPAYSKKPEDAPAERASTAATTIAKASNADAALFPAPAAMVKPGPAQNLVIAQQQEAMAAANRPAKPKYTGEPISVNLKDVDLKDFFRLIHEISGLNVVLDPGVRGNVTLVLDDVPWDQALDIVLKNNSLDRQLEGNVLRIASLDTIRKEAEQRRLQIEAQALAVDKLTVTRFLSYAHAKDAAPTVKKFLSPRGDVMFDERTNALIISDIPNTLPDIDRLLAQLDRKTQEVEIEARVVAANRTFARDLGMQLGFGWGNGPSAIGGIPGITSAISPIKITGLDNPKYLINNGQIPLFSNHPASNTTSGLSFTNATSNYRVDAILTMAESRGLVKILSRPRIVTQNNVAATVRQGFHVPVVTAAQLGGPPTTTYIDAFLKLTVTPQITVENTIFLAVDVENTTPDFGQTVGGNPTLITQQATTQVLVSDGGTVVIGGVIQTQNSVSTSQTPLLGDIPVLGNLFKRRSVNTETRELIFFISPRIIQT